MPQATHYVDTPDTPNHLVAVPAHASSDGRRGSPLSEPSHLGFPVRPARVLIGWMEPNLAIQLLTNQLDRPTREDAERRVASARQNVETRLFVPLDQGAITFAVPPEIDAYVAELAVAPGPLSVLLAQGWCVRTVDLTALCAFQPVVFSDGIDRVLGITSSAPTIEIARLTIPRT
jgi:hypothetical protein